MATFVALAIGLSLVLMITALLLMRRKRRSRPLATESLQHQLLR
jgi:LPXTG-motif cell wall-anchored protein